MQKGIYLHFKGGTYEVLDVVTHSETLGEMVLYRHQGETALWVRPKEMFEETVEKDGKKVPRFSFVGESSVPLSRDEHTPIFFYEPDYYFLSNFSAFSLLWKGVRYMTAEHAYQSEKFFDDTVRQSIQDSCSARDAVRIAHLYRDVYRAGWKDIKIDVMKEILRAKTMQYPFIVKKLIESGNRPIIENSFDDDF